VISTQAKGNKNLMKKYQNYELTEHLCKPIAEGHSKSRDIYAFIDYPGTYSCFRSSLSKIKRAGYIKFGDYARELPKNPFHRKRTYILTEKGQRFLLNPNERWQKKQARLHNQLMKLIEIQPEFLQKFSEQRAMMNPEKVIEFVNANMGLNYSDIGQVDQLLEGMDDFKSAMVDDNPNELEELRRKYNALVLENQRLRNLSVDEYKPPKAIKPTVFNQQKSGRNRLAEIRKQVTQEYFNVKYLDLRFFGIWQNIIPVKLKGAKMFTKNSVEFISSGNKEFKRGHAKEMDGEQIASSCLYIVRLEDDGIIIAGKGVAKSGEKMKF